MVLYLGDMLALGSAFHLAHQVLIPAQGMERKVLVLTLAKASSCSDLETAKELYACVWPGCADRLPVYPDQ